MSNIVTTHLYLKDRSLLTKKYIDLTLTPLIQSTPKTHLYSTRPYIPKSTSISLPQRSDRSLQSSKNFKFPDQVNSNLLRSSYTRSTKSSILNLSQTRPQHSPNTKKIRFNPHKKNQFRSIPVQLPSTTLSSFTPRGLQGYNFSKLNSNRTIIKSKFLSKLN